MDELIYDDGSQYYDTTQDVGAIPLGDILRQLAGDVGGTAMDVGNAAMLRNLWGDQEAINRERASWYNTVGAIDDSGNPIVSAGRAAIRFGTPGASFKGIPIVASAAPKLLHPVKTIKDIVSGVGGSNIKQRAPEGAAALLGLLSAIGGGSQESPNQQNTATQAMPTSAAPRSPGQVVPTSPGQYAPLTVDQSLAPSAPTQIQSQRTVQPTAPTRNINDERNRFMVSVINQIGFNPLTYDPENESLNALKSEYEQRYGAMEDWVNHGLIGQQFRADLDMAIRFNTAKRNTALNQFKFAMDQFEKTVTPIMVNKEQIAIDPSTRQIISRNTSPIGPGYAIQDASGNLITNRQPVIYGQDQNVAIPSGPGYRVIQGQGKAPDTEQLKQAYKVVTAKYIDIAKANFNKYATKYFSDKTSDKERAKLKSDPVNGHRYAQVEQLDRFQRMSPDKFNEAIDENFMTTWLEPGQATQMRADIANLSTSIRNAATPQYGIPPNVRGAASGAGTNTQSQYRPKPGDRVIDNRDGKTKTIKSVSPDGKTVEFM